MQLSYGDTVDRTPAPAPAPSTEGLFEWVEEQDINFEAAPLAGPFTSGTATIEGYVVETFRSSTTDGTTQVVDEGLRTRATSGGGNVNTAIRLNKPDSFFTEGPGVVVVQAVYTLAELTGSNSYWVAGVSNKNQQAQAFCGVACNWAAGGNVTVATYYDTVSLTTIYSGVVPTEWKLTVVIYQGRQARVKFEPNVSTIDDVPPATGYSFIGQPVLAANTAQFFGASGFNWLASLRSNGHTSSVVLKRLRTFRLVEIT